MRSTLDYTLRFRYLQVRKQDQDILSYQIHVACIPHDDAQDTRAECVTAIAVHSQFRILILLLALIYKTHVTRYIFYLRPETTKKTTRCSADLGKAKTLDLIANLYTEARPILCVLPRVDI